MRGPARLAVTRSFGQPIGELEGVLAAVTMYAARAGEKLWTHGLVAGQLTAFLHNQSAQAGTCAFAGRSKKWASLTTFALFVIHVPRLRQAFLVVVSDGREGGK